MPIYEYQCDACGDRTEVLQRVGAPPIGACGSCGGEMKRLLSAPAFQFKGSGWYVTDYAKKASPSAGEPKSGKDASKSETKESAGASSEPGKKDSKEGSAKTKAASG